jgi:phage shock protein A
MFAFFKRLFGIGKAKETAPAPAVVDKQKAPEKMTVEEIKILKAELNSELQKLAEAKAIAIRTKRDIENDKQLLEAEQIPAETLIQRAEMLKRYEENLAKKQKYDRIVAELETNIRQLKTIISIWEQATKGMKGMIIVKGRASIKMPDKEIKAADTENILAAMKAKIDQKEADEKNNSVSTDKDKPNE